MLTGAHKTNGQVGRKGRCGDLGEFAHYTMTRQQLRSLDGKLAGGWNKSGQMRQDYAAIRSFMIRHLPGSPNNATEHNWCGAQRVEAVLQYRLHLGTREQWLLKWWGGDRPERAEWSHEVLRNNETVRTMAGAVKAATLRNATLRRMSRRGRTTKA